MPYLCEALGKVLHIHCHLIFIGDIILTLGMKELRFKGVRECGTQLINDGTRV